MLGRKTLVTKPASRIQTSDPTNRFLPKYTYDVALALIANAAEHSLRKKLLGSGDFHFPSVQDLNNAFAKLIKTVWCDHSGVGGPRVAYAASSWVDISIRLKPSYNEEVRKVYKDVVNQIDYSAKDVMTEVNYWASKGTASLITDLVPGSYSGAIDETTLVFASTLYFQDLWNVSFDPSQTKSQDFYTLGGGSVRVPFMTRKNKMHHLLRVDTGVPVPFSVLSLPYRQGQDSNFTMLIVLPRARDGLPNLLSWMYRKEYQFLNDCYPHKMVEVDNLLIPRFKVSGGDPDPHLDFLPGSPPYDLTGMVDPPRGQKFNFAFNCFRWSVEVSEQGTTVAGAVADFVKQQGNTGAPLVQKTTTTPTVAAAKMSGSGSGSGSDNDNGKVNFIADHPFFMFILETKHKFAKHDVVGFQGFVMDPTLN